MSNDSFIIELNWLPANKNFSYEEYSREYQIKSPNKPTLTASAAASYKGLADHYNPEDLLVAALSGCHMLSYLALAANSKVEILAYTDNAIGSLEKQGAIFKFKEVTLHPKITIKNSSDKEKAISLHDKAHHICFIANSVNFPVQVKPEIVVG